MSTDQSIPLPEGITPASPEALNRSLGGMPAHTEFSEVLVNLTNTYVENTTPEQRAQDFPTGPCTFEQALSKTRNEDLAELVEHWQGELTKEDFRLVLIRALRWSSSVSHSVGVCSTVLFAPLDR